MPQAGTRRQLQMYSTRVDTQSMSATTCACYVPLRPPVAATLQIVRWYDQVAGAFRLCAPTSPIHAPAAWQGQLHASISPHFDSQECELLPSFPLCSELWPLSVWRSRHERSGREAQLIWQGGTGDQAESSLTLSDWSSREAEDTSSRERRLAAEEERHSWTHSHPPPLPHLLPLFCHPPWQRTPSTPAKSTASTPLVTVQRMTTPGSGSTPTLVYPGITPGRPLPMMPPTQCPPWLLPITLGCPLPPGRR